MQKSIMEDTFDKKYEHIMEMLGEIEQKLKDKASKEIKEIPLKNSHIHIMINTEEKKKLVQKAKEDGIPFAEWCRRKIRSNPQLDRIERKLDKLLC